MADPNVAAAGHAEQQYSQHQYAYQSQAVSPGGQYYSAASGAEQHQAGQEDADPQVAGQQQQQQEVAYAQYTRSGAEVGGEQDPNAAYGDANSGIIQQYVGATGQLAQQQGANGYKINFDPNPQIIHKHAKDAVTYKQEVAVRYLRPPTPPPPGPLIIKEIRNPALPAAPPIVIRQRPPRPATPPPLVIRERPPQPPPQLAPKVITKPLPPPPPPPRRVIIERMPPLPPKPQSIIVERWLPYKQQKRRVVYQKAPPVPAAAPQKNLIIQWEGTQARVVKEFRNLGIIKADPGTYVQQYGSQLRTSQGLPDFIKGLPTPNLGPEYAPINPDQIDPSLLAGAAGPISGLDGAVVDPSLLGGVGDPSLGAVGQAGFAQENVQYAAYGGAPGQVAFDQQGGFAYQQQAAYSNVSTAEEQQYAVDPQQGFEQGGNFAQNVQYQSMPQYGPSG